MIFSRKNTASALTAAAATAVVALTASPCAVAAFSTTRGVIVPSSRIRSRRGCRPPSFATGAPLRAATTTTTEGGVDTDPVLPSFSTKEEYVSYLKAAGKLPSGFAVGTATGEFVSVEAPAMGKLPIKATVIHLTEGPTDSWAAVFTSNKFPGCPVKVGKSRLSGGHALQALVINNKISNVCPGGDGIAAAELVCDAVATSLNLSGGANSVLPSSTGVIGWRLPAKELAEDIVPTAIEALQTESAFAAAEAIMTTDRYPKLRSKTLSDGTRIVGVAKGAGMIEPNMATMLGYIMTDAMIEKSKLQSMLTEACDRSFNSISIDGDESTSDTVVAIASGLKPLSSEDEFRSALLEVTGGLSADLVRNGEGTGHVIRVAISNFPGSEYDARRMGRHLVNSPLVKCAISGNDPNTGRIAGAIGSFMGKFFPDESVDDMSLTLGGRTIFDNGKFVLEGDAVERELSGHMANAQLGEHDDFPRHQSFVEIGVDFGGSTGSDVTVLGSDLTKEYVVVNADYRS
eukprot:CAMPEP_0172527758 /NCGR_PEP_ID=MMETSP1067-20121228/2351_1 /TAXON_ID=265564 ORGANISM="Thalassiosira punctigera, Strain Tpunct2005C2" /NCGR_SAMPLE_ID=MMETSP1067 /ASSEMBLY_ACC=CAM_ASM_000444 /LENGTH=515 /DNA_ID=CAMNT_0013311555 /DNA_START=171 /DNA_END=1718 /DNA_ORIENTATION=-